MIQQSAVIDTMTGLVIFELSNKEFCADIRDISAMINPSELGQNENLQAQSNPYININNLNIPLIPIHKYFGLELKFRNNNQRILILEPDDIMFGFYVERVKEIFTMSKDFKDKLTFTPDKENDYLSGIIHYEDRQLYLPDFEKIVVDVK